MSLWRHYDVIIVVDLFTSNPLRARVGLRPSYLEYFSKRRHLTSDTLSSWHFSVFSLPKVFTLFNLKIIFKMRLTLLFLNIYRRKTQKNEKSNFEKFGNFWRKFLSWFFRREILFKIRIFEGRASTFRPAINR